MNLHKLYGQFLSNAQFRQAFLDDPEKAIEQAGFDLSDEEMFQARDIIPKYKSGGMTLQSHIKSGGASSNLW